MNRKGIALLSTLWLLALLSLVVAGALSSARLERGATVNRIALARGRWAAEGCLARLEADLASTGVIRSVDSVDLGSGLWCRATVEDPGARVRLDVVNAQVLERLVGDPSLSAPLLDWLDPDSVVRELGAETEWYRSAGGRPPRDGPMGDVEELRFVRGFGPEVVDRLRPLLSARGGSRVNVNIASVMILAAIPGFDRPAAELVGRYREVGRKFRSLDDLLSALPVSLRAPAMARYAELNALVVLDPERLVLHLEGYVPESGIVARRTIEVLPVDRRLAVLAREEW